MTLYHETVHQATPRARNIDIYSHERGFRSLAVREPSLVTSNPDTLVNFGAAIAGRQSGAGPTSVTNPNATAMSGFSNDERDNLDIAIGALEQRVDALSDALMTILEKAQEQVDDHINNGPPSSALMSPSATQDFNAEDVRVLETVRWALPTSYLRSVDLSGLSSASHTRLLDLDPMFEFINAGSLVGPRPLLRQTRTATASQARPRRRSGR